MVAFHFVFFFKQKRAYELRISDWSSDVFSSDLYGLAPAGAAAPAARMVMSIWRCSLLDQYFELETGSRGAARSPPCAPETGGQPVNFHVTDCVSESEIGLPLWSFAGVDRKSTRLNSSH